MERLFVYGSLRDPEVQQRVFGRVVPGTPDVLDGYERRWLHLSDGVFPILVPAPGGSVEGRVLDVTPGELALMDAYESDDYRRIRVTLRSGAETWVYAE